MQPSNAPVPSSCARWALTLASSVRDFCSRSESFDQPGAAGALETRRCLYEDAPLDATRLLDLYQSLGFSEARSRELEAIRTACPSRKVGKSALTNSVTYIYSAIMGKHLIAESRTCEGLYYMELEFQAQALGIYPQPELIGIERFSPSGHRTVSTIHAEALVYFPHEIVFVECKLRSELEKLARKYPTEWIETPDGFRRPHVERWCEMRGCRYVIWSPDEPHGIYWANLQFLHPLITRDKSTISAAVSNAVQRLVRDKPATLAQVLALLPEVSPTTVAMLLVQHALYANLSSGLLNEPASIILSTDPKRANRIDADGLTRIKEGLKPLSIDDPIMVASTTDYARGLKTLEIVEAMISGTRPVTRRFENRVKAVRLAKQQGRDPLPHCITSFANSGNRSSRLTPTQETLVENVITEEWDSGKVTTPADLFIKLKKRMEKYGELSVPSKTSLMLRVRKRSRAPHDLSAGGNRAFHQNRPHSDPAQRTPKSLGRFVHAHIDATKFDNRSAAEELPEFPFSCPTLYVAIDTNTGEPLGRSITFGPASRFGLALLLRDIVQRHGRLPSWWTADRGSELWSKMVIAFAEEVRINLVMRPAGAARYGSEVENALKKINRAVAHKLIGSSLLDQKGRSVDAKFKSYKTACLVFRVVVEAVDGYLFADWLDDPIGELGATPRERIAEADSYFDAGGIEVSFDDNFILQTSVPMDDEIKIYPGEVIRWRYRRYTSAELKDLLRVRGKPDSFRVDCADPSLGYAKFGEQWVKVRESKYLEFQVKAELDRIFDQVFTRDLAKNNRAKKDEARERTTDRVDFANASAASTQNVRPSAEQGRSSGDASADRAASVRSTDQITSGWDIDASEVPLLEDSPYSLTEGCDP